MTADRPPLKFEDLVIGEERRSSSRTITEAEIVEFARQYDPQWFHTDPEAARQSHFGEVVASGVHVLAIWRQLDHEINSDIDYVCGIGFDNFRLKTALRPGDTVYVTSRILSKELSKSGKPRGTCVGYYEMRNQNDQVVLQFESINLVHTRAAAAREGPVNANAPLEK
ncbi:MAG: MaoC family dehydratase N-terminal domain-containing protein [Erythrobacter sp.]|nr:MAG: MaoC family dehydratase N-terminal domain-containing protein [Erythrobacter sp.]